MQKEFLFYSLHTGHTPDGNRVKFEVKDNNTLELEFNYYSMNRKSASYIINLKDDEELENRIRELFKDSEKSYDDIYFFRTDIYILNSIIKLARKVITVEEFFKNLENIFEKQRENTYFEYEQIRKY
ncbi:hypothetical protein [Fusobacterium sp. oral taxon 203]|uniref:hypothetical protein n=1 Tax=Fusobacterium sp. oral taxon 203 TaxID=671211 RepID=UPI000B92585B|nr:hypothetical protein [Fusobacterium sp. oral taxon 203]ASS39579.1 hypothetical protein AXF16_05675 [Fusobacterium sp. oral taxon 203]